MGKMPKSRFFAEFDKALILDEYGFLPSADISSMTKHFSILVTENSSIDVFNLRAIYRANCESLGWVNLNQIGWLSFFSLSLELLFNYFAWPGFYSRERG